MSAYGEMVGLLWERGETAAALELEQFWNTILPDTVCSLFCGYPIDMFGHDLDVAGVNRIVAAHTCLVPAAPYIAPAVDQALTEVFGGRARTLKQLMRSDLRPSLKRISEAEAMLLWLRANVPAYAGEVSARARRYANGSAYTN